MNGEDLLIAIAWHCWCILNHVDEHNPSERDIDKFSDYYANMEGD